MTQNPYAPVDSLHSFWSDHDQRIVKMEQANAVIACRSYNTAALVIPSGVPTPLTFNADRWDVAGCHSTDTNSNRFVAVEDGFYLMTVHATWTSNTFGARRLVGIRNQDALFVAREEKPPAASTSTFVAHSVMTVYYLSAGQWLEAVAVQDTGADLSIVSSGNSSPEVTFTKIA